MKSIPPASQVVEIIEKLWIVEISISTQRSPDFVEFPTSITTHVMSRKYLSEEF